MPTRLDAMCNLVKHSVFFFFLQHSFRSVTGFSAAAVCRGFRKQSVKLASLPPTSPARGLSC